MVERVYDQLGPGEIFCIEPDSKQRADLDAIEGDKVILVRSGELEPDCLVLVRIRETEEDVFRRVKAVDWNTIRLSLPDNPESFADVPSGSIVIMARVSMITRKLTPEEQN